jgi:hypothetical protein
MLRPSVLSIMKRCIPEPDRTPIMRVLALYPAFDVQINEMAMVWEHLSTMNDLDCLVFAGARDILKGFQSASDTEQRGRLQVQRLAELKPSAEMLQRAAAFRPDVIYCAVTENLGFARALRRQTGAPIILHTEYFLDDLTFLRRRYHGGVPLVRRFASMIGRTLLHRTCTTIVVSNPVDHNSPEWNTFGRLRYLPWPHPHPEESLNPVRRNSFFSAHIGSLSRGKGAAYLQEFYGALLRTEPEFRMLLVGPAIDEEGQRASRSLHDEFPDRVEVLAGCSRAEAMDLLRASLFVFSPALRYGWGLIGDAWGTGTPVISRTVHYDLKDGVNCLVAPDAATFVRHAVALKNDEVLFATITKGGTETVAGHAPEVVAETLMGVLRGVVPR